jgi:heat shock protein HtpX
VILFLATNLAILIVLGVALVVIEGVLASQGIRLPNQRILVFAFVFGMGGAFLSLAMSKTIARWSTGAQVIEQPRTDSEAWLVETVRRLAGASGIGMPDVAVYEASEPNAFATGARRNSALVAVSSGLLRRMERDEVEAVLGHEVSHVANGDMITLTLIQGVLNTFVLLFSRVIGQAVDRMISRDGDRGFGIGYLAGTILSEILLGILATMIVFWFSRRREFRADAGAARLVGPGKMIAALQRLAGAPESQLPESMAAFGIQGGGGGALARLFRTHPPIEARIAALRALGG